MRLSFLLLVAATALIVRSDATSTTGRTKILLMNAPDAVDSVGVASVKSARFLRSESKKQADVQDSEEEERGKIGPIDDAVKTIGGAKKLLANDDLAAEAAKKLSEEGYYVKMLIDAWKRQKLKPGDLNGLTKTPIAEIAKKEFTAQYYKAMLPDIEKRVSPRAFSILKRWNKNYDNPQALISQGLVRTKDSKEAYDMFFVQHMIRINSVK